jgi:hypothetical protein
MKHQECSKLTKQLKVNLDKQYNPNPGIEKAYKEANAMDLWLDKDIKSEYLNEAKIFRAFEASGVKIKHNIFSIYRKKVGKKEYRFFFDKMVTEDYFANKHDWTRLVGRWEKPIIISHKAINLAAVRSGEIAEIKPEPQPSEIDSIETMYDYEFQDMIPQLREWYNNCRL